MLTLKFYAQKLRLMTKPMDLLFMGIYRFFCVHSIDETKNEILAIGVAIRRLMV